MLKYSQKKQAGFTLVELLVVLVILSILMTIAFIFIGDQGKRARLATAASSVKSSMTIVAACKAVGLILNPAPDGIRGPSSQTICIGNISNTAYWPELPDGCLYCGISGNRINFQCKDKTSCTVPGITFSYCDFDSTQCIQND